MLNDGGEVDLDLGNYERYLDITLSRDNNITTGKIYKEVIEKEVRGPCSVTATDVEESVKKLRRLILVDGIPSATVCLLIFHCKLYVYTGSYVTSPDMEDTPSCLTRIG